MLTWEDVKVKFENLVKFAAKDTYVNRSRVDSAISAEDLYQIGMLKLFDCWQRYSYLPMEDFKRVFSTTLFRAVKRGAKNASTFDIEEALSIGVESHENDYVDLQAYKEGLAELKGSLVSPIAIAILQELIEPSPKTIWEVWADRARKDFVKKQGKNLNLSKTTDVKMKHIRNSLQITQKQFDIGIFEIRQKAKLSFALESC